MTLRVNALSGFGARRSPPVTITLGSEYSDLANLTTYTHAVTWEAFANGRVVAVFVSGHSDATSGRTVSTVTIDGISASILAQDTGSSGGSDVSAVAVAFIPVGSGASGDVVVAFSGAMEDNTISVATLFNVNSITPSFTGSDNAVGTSVSVASVTDEPGGVVLVSASHNVEGTGLTFTNITEQRDTNGAGSARHGVAFDLAADFAAPLTVSVTHASSDRFSMAVASIR